jgi:hypothetical protein
MKSLYPTVLFCLFISCAAFAAPKYWVGPQNGNWSNTANWSDLPNGAGGAILPGSQDSAFFPANASSLVRIDQSPAIASLQIQGNVTLYASTPVVFTILHTLIVPYLQTLKDSTSADVPFNMVFKGSTNATASIIGDWVFEGGAPLSNRLTAGATFTIEAGASVAVSSTNYGVNYDYLNYQPGQIIFKNNTGTISNSDFRTLVFTYNTHLIFDNDLDATIPAANWFGDQLDRYGRFVQSPAASIQVKTNMRKLAFAQTYPDLTRLVIDLAGLDADAGLTLPDGSNLRNNLEVYNTNGHTLSLLAANSPASSVTATVWGNIVVNGNNSKVALATAAAAAPATGFYLTVLGDFNQGGGNFSLQEYNGATGISALSCKSNFSQT